MDAYYVYILASRNRALYVGLTNDLVRRMYQHKSGTFSGFTRRYNVNRLVHYEVFNDVRDAKKREKQLKGWRRERKIELIEAENSEWEDLADRVGLPLSAHAA